MKHDFLFHAIAPICVPIGVCVDSGVMGLE